MKTIFATLTLVIASFMVTSCALFETEEQAELKRLSALDYVGLTLAEAENKSTGEGASFRVVNKNGIPQAVTMDYRPGRINAYERDGKVESYNIEGETQLTKYNSKSWETFIDKNCQSFFDGCNNCNRQEGSDMAACTRKGCLEYKKPECLDEK